MAALAGELVGARPTLGRTTTWTKGEGVDLSVFMIVRVAFKALGRNKMRTVLTMLGMIIGVAAVITMASGAPTTSRLMGGS